MQEDEEESYDSPIVGTMVTLHARTYTGRRAAFIGMEQLMEQLTNYSRRQRLQCTAYFPLLF